MEGAATVSIETADVYAGVQSCVRRYLSRYWNFFLFSFSIFFFYFLKKQKNQSIVCSSINFHFDLFVKVIQNDSKINRTRLCARMWFIFSLISFNYRDILHPMMIDRCAPIIAIELILFLYFCLFFQLKTNFIINMEYYLL